MTTQAARCLRVASRPSVTGRGKPGARLSSTKPHSRRIPACLFGSPHPNRPNEPHARPTMEDHQLRGRELDDPLLAAEQGEVAPASAAAAALTATDSHSAPRASQRGLGKLKSAVNKLGVMRAFNAGKHRRLQRGATALSDEDTSDMPSRESCSFTASLSTFLVVQTALYFLFVDYTVDARVAGANASESGQFSDDESLQYLFYLNVTVMMTVGFGFLMTFLRNYGLGAVGYTFLVTAVVMPWTVLTGKFFSMVAGTGDYPEVYGSNATNFTHLGWGNIEVNPNALLQGQFAVAAVLISFGAVIGKVSPSQLIFMGVLESVFYAVNKEVVCLGLFNTADMGGSIFIHLFGAYFGLSVARVLGVPSAESAEDEEPSIVSDLFSLIGTVFLWTYWPSFNGATAGGGPEGGINTQLYTTVNTVLALCSSCAWTFVLSRWLNKARLSPVDIQNATLAGGVAVGASSNLDIGPGWALLIGAGAAAISCLGFNLLQPKLQATIGLHDSCGVHNLHGMPALFGGLVSAVALAGHSDHDQAGVSQPVGQLLGIVATLVVAIVSGVGTGFFIKKLVPGTATAFRDDATWAIAYKRA